MWGVDLGEEGERGRERNLVEEGGVSGRGVGGQWNSLEERREVAFRSSWRHLVDFRQFQAKGASSAACA